MSTPTLALKSYFLSDTGNAERLADLHGDSIRFCTKGRLWFVWDRPRWAVNRDAVHLLAIKTVHAMRMEGKFIPGGQGDEELQALAKWSRFCDREDRIRSMVRIAEWLPPLNVPLSIFDRDPSLLNLSNGTLELESGRFRQHMARDLITKVAAVNYDSEAKCPRWEQFLLEVFTNHPKMVSFLQRAIGYSISGDVRERCIFVLAGAGFNGKSTLLRVLHDVLGDYSRVVNMDALLEGRRSGPQDDVANMCGRRLVIAQEPRDGRRFDRSLIKWLTGDDVLTVRRMYKSPFEFVGQHKIWMSVNDTPEMVSADPAFWDRVRVLRCDASFRGCEDPMLKHSLFEERAGILNWAVRGYHSWARMRLSEPRAVLVATDNWRRQGSPK
jgi:putative DNA primase/helicase